MPKIIAGFSLIFIMLLTGCGGDSDSSAPSEDHSVGNGQGGDSELKSVTLVNKTAYVPSQCYTRTDDERGNVHNPCFTCHQDSLEPNYINDASLQLSYDFPEYALTNHWDNLFQDRSQQVAEISDEAILDYVRADNYQGPDGQLLLAERLKNLPAAWDYENDGKWDGYLPDCYFNFDEMGFDRAPDGDYTGWRAFGYYPFPGTFWPANGSTDDVLIRLAPEFRQDSNGQFNLMVYRLNLAIVEALITRRDVAIPEVDENLYAVDLNKDGVIGKAAKIVYDWAPLEGRHMSYVGLAKQALDEGRQQLAAGLFPLNTEFLHSVRYLDLNEHDEILLSARMKELRYARKRAWQTYFDLRAMADADRRENVSFPDRLRQVLGDMEHGVDNGMGWIYQGFIEDADGELRPQTYEENVFCVGCHSTVGAITDSIFAFPRKFAAKDAFQEGWYHWSQRDIKGLPEPRRADGEYEYTHYLRHNGAGDEFRANREIISEFFNADGSLNQAKIEALREDISVLLWPSRQRALDLNKAYRVIVREQSFIRGRDATITPPENVHREVEAAQSTGVETSLKGPGLLME